MEKRDLVLKVSIPFCVKKCEYCTRCIVEGWDSALLHRYMEAVQREIGANAAQFEDFRVKAVHFGGGLASMANAQDVSNAMRLIRAQFDTCDDLPVTMRSALVNISGASMPFFKRAGITRFDFEMMSLSPAGYAALNVRDSLGDLPVICDHFLHSAQNNNLGMVLVFGSAEAGPENFERSIAEFTRLHPDHLILQEYEGAEALSAEERAAQLEAARECLAEAGYVEYLPLRFARQGGEDAYSMLRAQGCETLAFGLDAVSCVEGVRTRNTSDLATYLDHSGDYTKITVEAAPL